MLPMLWADCIGLQRRFAIFARGETEHSPPKSIVTTTEMASKQRSLRIVHTTRCWSDLPRYIACNSSRPTEYVRRTADDSHRLLSSSSTANNMDIHQRCIIIRRPQVADTCSRAGDDATVRDDAVLTRTVPRSIGRFTYCG